jgi:hypothetical protein
MDGMWTRQLEPLHCVMGTQDSYTFGALSELLGNLGTRRGARVEGGGGGGFIVAGLVQKFYQ